MYNNEPDIMIPEHWIKETNYDEQTILGKRIVTRTVWFTNRQGESDADISSWEEEK